MQNLKFLFNTLFILSIELSDVVKNKTIKLLVFKQNSSVDRSNVLYVIDKKVITLICFCTDCC